MWTTVLSYTIFSVISIGAVNFKLWHARVFCWTLPLILTLLPISTNNYGAGSPDVQWCLIVARDNTPPGMTQFWAFAAFFFWLFLSIFLMVFWAILIHCRYWKTDISDLVRNAYGKVYLYPVAMSCCWVTNFICTLSLFSTDRTVVALNMIFAMLNSVFSALLFMRNYPWTLLRWKKVMLSLFISWHCGYVCCCGSSSSSSSGGGEGGRRSSIVGWLRSSESFDDRNPERFSNSPALSLFPSPTGTGTGTSRAGVVVDEPAAAAEVYADFSVRDLFREERGGHGSGGSRTNCVGNPMSTEMITLNIPLPERQVPIHLLYTSPRMCMYERVLTIYTTYNMYTCIHYL